MLWPSPIRVSMAGTPSFVAGTLTRRLGWAMRWCRLRADVSVSSVS